MDTLVIMSSFPYILPLLIIVVSMFLFFFIFQKSKANVPPGSSGWPVVGENIKFVLSGPQEFVEERTKIYSQDVFQSSLFGQKMAVFCGPQGNKFLFANETKSLTSWWPLSVKKALFFPEVVGSSTDEISSLMFCFLREILKPEALKQYVPVMDSMAREHVELEWVGNEVVKVYPVAKMYTFELACRLLMSVVDPDMVRRLAKHFTLVNAGFREVVKDFTYAGFTIPKGWKTLWTVHSTHKNPRHFPNPEAFDPSRFEGTGPAPQTFVPFGGGARMCPGKEYARLEILVFLRNIVTKFKFKKVSPQEKIALHFLPVPMEGLPVQLIPHKS